jgi:hypothetical protein
VLIDLTVPAWIMQSNFAPFNEYSQFFPVLDSRLRYASTVAPFVVGPTGALERVGLRAIATARLRSATLSSTAGLKRPITHSTAECLPSGPPQQLRVPLPEVVHLDSVPGGLPIVVSVRYQLPIRADVTVMDSPVGGLPEPVDGVPHIWGPGAGVGTAIVTAPATTEQLQLDLPGGACIARLTLDSLTPAP